MNTGLIYAGVALLVVVIAIITVLVLRRRPTTTIAHAPDAKDVAAEQLVPEQPVPEQPVPEEISTTLEVEIPAAAAGRLHRLRARLARSNNAIGKGLLALLSAGELTDSTWDQVEETLLMADLGVGPTQELIARLRTRVQVAGTATPEQIKAMLHEELLILVDPTMDRSIVMSAQGRPAVILVVGVNGTGKTTTTGKLARLLIADGQTVVLGAADTFRAARK